MTHEDLEKMPAGELDALIAMAAKERTKRSDPHPPQAPTQLEATFNPAWSVFLADGNTIVQIKHLGHGWISVAIPPRERAHLLSLFLHHSLIAPPPPLGEAVPGPVPVPPSSGGGTVH